MTRYTAYIQSTSRYTRTRTAAAVLVVRVYDNFRGEHEETITGNSFLPERSTKKKKKKKKKPPKYVQNGVLFLRRFSVALPDMYDV